MVRNEGEIHLIEPAVNTLHHLMEIHTSSTRK